MTNLEEVLTCPLGSACREIKDNKAHKCMWYQKFVGTDAQGNDRDDFDCAMNWSNVLALEAIRGNGGIQAAVESARNEQVKMTGQFLAIRANDAQDITALIDAE